MTASRVARVLIVAGSDSGGGAGIQADIKTVTALGGYAATAITALTAQNTVGVPGIQPVPADFIALQMQTVLDDIGADAVKIGMVDSAPNIDAICDVLEQPVYRHLPIVVDPVMIAKSGTPLLDPEASATLKRRLLLIADVLTPNVPEAERLTGMNITDRDGMRAAAEMLLTTGPRAVLLKGGHMEGATVIDILATPDGIEELEGRRIDSRNTHGTGCTLSSAVATGLGQGLSLREAVMRARAYLLAAIEAAPDLGAGAGPLWHGHTVRSFP